MKKKKIFKVGSKNEESRAVPNQSVIDFNGFFLVDDRLIRMSNSHLGRKSHIWFKAILGLDQ